MLEEKIDERQALTDKNTSMALAAERLEAIRSDEQPQVEELEREIYENESKMKKLNKTQGELQKDIKTYKEQTTQQQERLETNQIQVANQRHENSKLASQVVRSPDKLQAHLEEMQANLETNSEALNEATQRSRQIARKKEMLVELHANLQKCMSSLEGVAEETQKVEREENELKQERARIAKCGEQFQECEADEQHLKREAELIAERVARLDNQKMQKHLHAAKSLDGARSEMQSLETEKATAQEQLGEGEKFVNMMKSKITALQQKHEKDMSATSEQLTLVASELRNFHQKMSSAMSQTA